MIENLVYVFYGFHDPLSFFNPLIEVSNFQRSFPILWSQQILWLEQRARFILRRLLIFPSTTSWSYYSRDSHTSVLSYSWGRGCLANFYAIRATGLWPGRWWCSASVVKLRFQLPYPVLFRAIHLALRCNMGKSYKHLYVSCCRCRRCSRAWGREERLTKPSRHTKNNGPNFASSEKHNFQNWST